MSGPEIITFGCRLNSFESEIMRGHAQAAGLDDLVVVHTCAVTAEAERQARQAIRRARRSHPRARIVVTGCSAQIGPEAYAAMAEVDHVVGNHDKLDARLWRELAHGPRVVVRDVMTVRETAGHLVDGFDGRTRGFVQVQNGCDHRCTFCIIPYGRGPSRSVPAGEVVEQTRRLVDAGYREVVLTGVDLTSYGKDLPGQPTIGQLVRRLLRLVPELPRLRLSSIDPAEVDPDLVDLVATEPRLMPHLHLSVQAGDDLILKRMKRRHGRADVVRLCADLRALRPDIAFGADLIAGFPTETEAMFLQTLELIDDAGLTHLHVFPFSARRGTPAARMPQLPKSTRQERAARLRQAGEQAMARFLERQIGRTAQILVERDGRGRSETLAPFRIETDSDAPVPGEIVTAWAERIERGVVIARHAA
jgi:threonylcarbamoyladenosine tRNA methylthiotransferase MtaB